LVEKKWTHELLAAEIADNIKDGKKYNIIKPHDV
jgi:hypothetical protein